MLLLNELPVANGILLMTMSRARIKGVTLFELVISLLLLSILTTIAYPSYLSTLHKSRRSDALATLAQDRVLLERCYAQHFSYLLDCGSLPAFPQTSAQGFYRINLTQLSATTYTLTATPIGNQAADTTCASIAVDQSGVKTALDSSATTQTICWNPR